jgi:transcriptional regulator with XRE-family HTH domain
MPRRTDPSLAEQLGARLREVRRQAGLTQDQVAERAGVPVETLSRAESGRLVPFLGTLTALARAYRVGLADLVDPGRPSPTPLSDDELQLLRLYRQLAPRRRGALRVLLDDTPATWAHVHEP